MLQANVSAYCSVVSYFCFFFVSVLEMYRLQLLSSFCSKAVVIDCSQASVRNSTGFAGL